MKTYSTQIINRTTEYRHIIQDRTLVIEKDGVKLSFNDEEIMQILKAVGVANSSFLKGFKSRNRIKVQP